MKIIRFSGFYQMAAVALAIVLSLAGASAVLAQDNYPSRPVHVVIGFSAGSSTDVAARIVAEQLGQVTGQRFIVENRPGASSNIATEYVTKAEADGYTLLMGTVANTINHLLRDDLNFNFVEDLIPIAQAGSLPNLLVVHPSVDVSNVEELIDYARQHPGALLYGSAGVGTAPHLSGELFNVMAGVDMVHVPYAGTGQAAADLVAGRIQLMFAPASSVIAQIQSGNLRALASTQLQRATIAPDLPTVDEAGLQGFDTGIWFGLLAPQGTPPSVVDTLADAVQTAVQSPSVTETFGRYGIEPLSGGPDVFSAQIASEVDKWAGVAAKVELAGE